MISHEGLEQIKKISSLLELSQADSSENPGVSLAVVKCREKSTANHHRLIQCVKPSVLNAASTFPSWML